MYILSLLNENRVIATREYHLPPTNSEIEKELIASGAWSFDIARKPLEEKDFEDFLSEDE